MVNQYAALVGATTLYEEKWVNFCNMSSGQYINLCWGETHKQLGSAHDSGGAITCSVNQCLPQCSMTL